MHWEYSWWEKLLIAPIILVVNAKDFIGNLFRRETEDEDDNKKQREDRD